jgi:hypothetical protein
MTAGPVRRLHRIVQGDPPSIADFTSKAQLGLPCPVPDSDVRHRWGGLSFFGTEAEARRIVRRLPMLGAFIATLEIPDAAGVNVERAYGPSDAAGDGPSRPTASGFQYEVWELQSRSLIIAYDDEDVALALVRQLLAGGWSADDLVLAAENEGLDVEDLPPTLTGAALAARAAP